MTLFTLPMSFPFGRPSAPTAAVAAAVPASYGRLRLRTAAHLRAGHFVLEFYIGEGQPRSGFSGRCWRRAAQTSESLLRQRCALAVRESLDDLLPRSPRCVGPTHQRLREPATVVRHVDLVPVRILL